MSTDQIEDKLSDSDPGERSKPRWGQERRLHFIDFRLQWTGRINRSDLMKFFGISTPQASADLSLYQQFFSGNTRYSASDKHYAALETFRARFPSSEPVRYLAQLLALNSGAVAPEETFLGTHPPVATVPIPARKVEEEILKALVRAVTDAATVQVDYQSRDRHKPTARSISPHAFGHDGKRWHVRAYCHVRSKFEDFIMSRILRVGPSALPTKSSADDTDWLRELSLILKPHPSLTKDQRRSIEVDYGMEGGRVVIVVRQAMLQYALQSLNLERDGHPRDGHYEVIIANLTDIKSYLPVTSGAN